MTSCRVPAAGLALAAAMAFAFVPEASAQGSLDALIAKHAAAHNVPESLVRRVIRIESRGNPRAVSKGNYGLMQIRLGTARAMGYRGDARGLLDADTNMTYAVKYLAGAYRVAGCNPDRAIRHYQRGYHGVKRYKCPGATQVASAAGRTAASAEGSSAAAQSNDVLKPRVVQTVAISRRDMESYRAPRAAASAQSKAPPPLPVARPKPAETTAIAAVSTGTPAAPEAVAPPKIEDAAAPAAGSVRPSAEAVPLPPARVAALQAEPEAEPRSAQAKRAAARSKGVSKGVSKGARKSSARRPAAQSSSGASDLVSMVKKLLTPEKKPRKRAAQVRQTDRHTQH